MFRPTKFIAGLIIAWGMCSLAQSPGQVSIRVIHSFSGPDGAQPFCPVMQGTDGVIYGTTQNRGAYGLGTVFKLNADGSGFSVLRDINPVTGDGQSPSDPVVQGTDGNLYGTSEGPPGSVLFRLNPDGSSFTAVRLFTNSPVHPTTLIFGSDGVLYGADMGGGNNKTGAVFKLSTDGSNLTVLHNFTTNSGEARSPYVWVLQGTDGALYGSSGGGINNGGALFRINTNGSDYSVLHYFSGFGDGAGPQTRLLQSADGLIYGMTFAGGNNGAGTVFKVKMDGTTYQIIYNFVTSVQGYNPGSAGLTQGPDGFLYGATSHGGIVNYGTLFRISTNGAGFAKLADLDYHAGPFLPAPCFGLSMGRDGSIYGTGLYGGLYGNGAVFQVVITPLKFTSCARLPDNSFQVSLSGASNTTLRIDASTDLVNWSALTNVVNVTGTVEFTDQGASNFPRRFYRAVWVP